ncbi:tripartite tricarboxylate transporter substrate binding protein [Bordetella sp. BOR01]|uniref:Bug family tripartite tricarboxylate transporter substrate binding protein n=1 Tax=Bordetella sp. BOR01 TaxID=2854779 RepID=UPI001C439D71|nr:tripartite tricarboxylate transporter substrate binding protein [Bordetella sp. BOR01]MBV7482765.1 tripartite tricarboxylate transporter substrate binding protein [Bordetella sp. BOR01]
MRASFLLSRIAALALAAVVGSASAAQDYPNHPVTLVVPYLPGGATDQVARALSQALTDKWKQPVVIVNRPGASGIIGSSEVIRAKPDGYTLLLSDNSTFVTVPHMLATVPFNVQRDFTPVTIVARQAAVLTVRNGFPAANVKELIEYARAHPGAVTFGSFGNGTWAHVAMEEMSRLANIEMLHVPFRGGAQVLTEMMAGRVDIFFATMGAVAPYSESGKLKVLATATADRLPSQPGLPTMSEDGLPGYSLSLWFGLVAPAQTPPAIVDRIRKDIAELNTDPAFQKALERLSLERGGETPQEFAKMLNEESERWRRVIEERGLKEQAGN